MYIWIVVKLEVIAVPSADFDGTYHTALTVYNCVGGALRASAGWTLRDAIEFYAREYGVEKGAVALVRPFFPQEKHLRAHVERT